MQHHNNADEECTLSGFFSTVSQGLPLRSTLKHMPPAVLPNSHDQHNLLFSKITTGGSFWK